MRHVLFAAGRGAALVAAAALAACSGNGASPPPAAGSQTAFISRGIVAIPGVPPVTGTFSFDISWIDTTAGQYYLADRTTAGVDVVNTTTDQYVLTAGKGMFTGLGIGTPAAANTGGPNGIVPIGGGIVFAGDGNSTLKVVNVTTGALVATIPTVNPVKTGTFSFCGTPTSGTANARLDEMDVDPTDGVVLAINDAACPGFGTFFSTTAPYAILGTIAFPNATAGVEAPVWDPTQGKFLVDIPASVQSPTGEIDVVDPKAFTITKTFPVPNCNPNSVAIGPNETGFLACSATVNPEMVTINLTTGAVINTISGFGGCDEAWYSPAVNRFYAACSNNVGGPTLIVANSSGGLIVPVGTAAGSHSVAADASGRAWVPERAVGINIFGP